MNLEQLNAMSDAELNELSAVKVMGYVEQEIDVILLMARGEWNPTTDMNDCFELQNALNEEELHNYTLRLMKMVSAFGHITYRDVTNILKSSARERTIASILAKGE